MAVGGNHVVDTTQLQSCIERLEQIYNNIAQVRGRLTDCLNNLKSNWTSVDTNDRNSYINILNKHLVELDQFVKLLADFKLLLEYYKIGYEEQANGRGDN